MSVLHEECGIAAVYQLDQSTAAHVNVTKYLPNLLLDLQNRGQLSAGMTSYNPTRECLLQTYRDLGTVSRVFRTHHQGKYQSIIDNYSGTAVIGHVRYATSGKEDVNFAQPFERLHGRKWKWFSIAFNGNLANCETLKAQLLERGYHITYNTDTEIMVHYFNKQLSGEEPKAYSQMFAELSEIFDGAFNIAYLDAQGSLVVVRDPHGIKPVCYGIKDNLLFVSSESVALTRMGIHDYQDLEPGTLLVANQEGVRIERYQQERYKAHCHFEWVYFANLASTLDQRSVFQARRALGRELAKTEDVTIDNDCMVVPVPETAKAAGSAFGFHLRMPVVEGIVRNPYVGRTFIEGTTRRDAISRKFTFLKEVLESKKIFLVDDSLVRAAMMKALISKLRDECGVAEIHVRISCPPIIAPCFYGIDIPTMNELFANKYRKPEDPLDFPRNTLQQMAYELGADSLKYLSLDGLSTAIGLSPDHLCTACVSTRYPTPAGKENYENLL